jgi:hypothetical protein
MFFSLNMQVLQETIATLVLEKETVPDIEQQYTHKSNNQELAAVAMVVMALMPANCFQPATIGIS